MCDKKTPIIKSIKNSKNEPIIELNDFKIYLKTKFEIIIEKNFDDFKILREIFLFNSNNFNKLIKYFEELKFHFEYQNQKVYSNYKKSLSLEKNLFPVYTKGDGNCLYNAISNIIFLNESDFFLIKSCALFTFLSYEKLFTNIIQNNQYEYNFEEFFCRMCRRYEWASELIILSISIFLRRTILCYSLSIKKEMTSRTKYTYFPTTNEHIRIGLMNNHFFPILRLGEIKEKECHEVDFINSDFIKRLTNEN